MDVEKLLAGLVRLGTVTAVDSDKRLARVKFQDTEFTSAWLPVLASPPSIPGDSTEQRTEYEVGGEGETAFESHKHDLVIKPWMPMVNDQVLTLYLPVFNADGFILGEVQTWR